MPPNQYGQSYMSNSSSSRRRQSENGDSLRWTLLLVLLFCVLSHITLNVMHPRLLKYYTFLGTLGPLVLDTPTTTSSSSRSLSRHETITLDQPDNDENESDNMITKTAASDAAVAATHTDADATTPTDDDVITDTTAIRSWGCDPRNETPFVFVHIGKAGGGTVRARLAASAMNYSRGSNWRGYEQDQAYYYPVPVAGGGNHNISDIRKAKMINSKMVNWLPPSLVEYHGDFEFEKWGPCGATTPLGQAIACPMTSHNHPYCNSSRCDLVYMGHNVIGSELHWLPTDYLVDWWKATPWGGRLKNADVLAESKEMLLELLQLDLFMEDTIGNELRSLPPVKLQALPKNILMEWWKSTPIGEREMVLAASHRQLVELLQKRDQVKNLALLLEDEEFCPTPSSYGHPQHLPDEYFEKCIRYKQEAVDTLAHRVAEVVDEYNSDKNNNHPHLVWSQMISSLPVVRVTMIREPFSWLVSKFMWHTEHYSSQGNGTMITTDRGPLRNKEQFIRNKQAGKPPPAPFVKCDDVQEAANGWASLRAVTYIVYLCGEHCWGQIAEARRQGNEESRPSSSLLVTPQVLQSIEEQAAYNLRNSFAVVGLLHKTQEFYDMISQRVSYMDTSLNPDVQGKKHSSNDLEEAKRCQQVFSDPTFQAQLLEQSPAVAALQRLYQVAVEVNEFQQKELLQCNAVS